MLSCSLVLIYFFRRWHHGAANARSDCQDTEFPKRNEGLYHHYRHPWWGRGGACHYRMGQSERCPTPVQVEFFKLVNKHFLTLEYGFYLMLIADGFK